MSDFSYISKNELVSVVNTRGSLKYVQSGMVPELKAQGWHIVVNPKRSYFPELDSENKYKSGPVEEELEEGNVLRFEDV